MKSLRHEKILEIIARENIDTQGKLRKMLAKEDIIVTQATLSRDIKALRLKKADDGNGGQKYVVGDAVIVNMLPPIFMDAVISADYAMNTVVFRCHNGMAQAACAVFDRLDCRGVVGTLAGDDTIFVLMRTENMAEELVDEINQLCFENNK
ncbi:MAG: ArgR family transcriptional regulator [Oscillospiraceae bacterium]|nr:ArgR family transcriptional regulator [Oscillospiraceae bacterium]